MPRQKATEPRDQQLLLRLTARQLEVLESVAHLDRSRPNAYVHQLLVQHLASMMNNPRVQADLANRSAYDDDTTTATPLRERAGTEPQAATLNHESSTKHASSRRS
jgi:hypothetical protein